MKIAAPLLAILSLASGAHAQQAIVFSTESYPPFSYQEPGGNYRGAGIDQVDMIMQDAGTPYTLEIMPWARAIAMAETQSMHCVFAAARTPEREPRFKWVVPLFVDRNILVRHAGSKVAATTLEEAKQYTVGTHRADYTEGLLKSSGFRKIDLSANVDTTLRKLLQDRIDMMPMSEGVYQKLKADGTPIEKVILFTEQHLGIACHPNVPDDLIARMQAGLDRLIKDGIQTAILKRYGIGEPQ
ncbi:ABC transporter substrate-binding protein [Neorhizobium galegae]|uniref:substrate-binding periplasmic protein n=1 Tax=Neorhizobium galegae TaxID=399 RepID=UPI0006214C54|nr:transporter substrate-binding domain-containing protein [Neorhizobium galegae]CDZ25317.1 Putative ABC-type amino acid transport protein, periplasmic component [Neorhizobium galegae bv. officinalis]KAA9387817.1 transporter substrate-binding domain-containing protein [Neorhizobium galegae]KAB1115712.1 transporter substrate-binding domain-containing protein [Neorhizobium galegae]MCM2498259.1 transporter substrate-binding domain-containing protein [Neorhizobium galegae]MCQ1765735.1 transporter 